MKQMTLMPLLALATTLGGCMQMPEPDRVHAPISDLAPVDEVERDRPISDYGIEAERVIEDGEEAEAIIGLADETAADLAFDEDADDIINVGIEHETGVRIEDW